MTQEITLQNIIDTRPETLKVNEDLKKLFNENFTPLIEKAKSNLNTNFNDKSYVLELSYLPKNKIYEFPIDTHTSKNHIKSMINTSKAPDFTTFIINYKFYFYQVLLHSINKKNSFHTITSHIKYFTVIFREMSNKFLNTNHEDYLIFKEIHTYFKNLLSTFSVFITQYIEQENELNNIEKKNYMKYEEILDIFNSLENITLKQNIKKLLLALYILEAPSRLEMMHTKFLLDITKNNLTDDYIFIDVQNDKAEVIFNKTKKSKKDIRYFINNRILKDLIFDSYNRYPRENIICSVCNKDKFINEHQKTKCLKSINPKFNINMLRSSYYTYHASLYKNYNEMNNDCFKSRTSVDNMMKHYLKK